MPGNNKFFYYGIRGFLKEVIHVYKNFGYKFAIDFIKWRPLRSFNITQNISKKKNLDEIHEVSFLKKNGFYIFKKLDESQIYKLRNLYEDLSEKKYGKSFDLLLKDLIDSGDARGIKCRFCPSKVEKILEINNIYEILEKSLDLQLNEISIRVECDTTIAPKSKSRYEYVTKNKGYDNALNFHRDLDGNKFLKYFIYLTDCNSENGPHIYVKSSANKSPLNFMGIKRLNFEEIIGFYKNENVVKMVGSKGFNFIEDTTGFHAGTLPENGLRMMLVIEFMDTCSSKFSSDVDSFFQPLNNFINK